MTVKLEHWSVTSTANPWANPDANPYTPPELTGVYLRGRVYGRPRKIGTGANRSR